MPPTDSDIPPKSAARRLKKRRSPGPPSALKSRGLILAILLILAVGIVFSAQGKEFLRQLYNPVAVIIVIFLVIEYIALKGRDRSRIYRIELDHARHKRQEDIEFLRRTENELRQAEKDLEDLLSTRPLRSAPPSPEEPQTPKSPEAASPSSGTPPSPDPTSPKTLRALRDKLATIRRNLAERL